MAGPTGRGGSLGAALNDLLRSQVTPRHRLSSYNAKHWHAQLSHCDFSFRYHHQFSLGCHASLLVTAQNR
ncbi:hypothetical protein [Streptomyces stelliscabiei]|uniref:hypothetical protein n=1 Tax=Streptomyces stelliscabiei TaxID=146820 RepID=UPI00099D378C|nr:hypothetical protein [Streptomyces stelliscabiei]MDX2522597.1 hypothetical protein [Streptomyces stelliscabiei]